MIRSVKSFRWLAVGLSIMLAGCRIGSFHAIGDSDPIGNDPTPSPSSEPADARVFALEPSHAVLYLAADGDAKGLYPSTIRFSVRELRGGDASQRQEGLRWESSAPEIAEIDADGLVRAVATGSVLVTLRESAGAAFEATASVTVKDGGLVDVVIE